MTTRVVACLHSVKRLAPLPDVEYGRRKVYGRGFMQVPIKRRWPWDCKGCGAKGVTVEDCEAAKDKHRQPRYRTSFDWQLEQRYEAQCADIAKGAS